MIGDSRIRCMCTADMGDVPMDFRRGEMCPLCEAKSWHEGSPQRWRLEWKARVQWWLRSIASAISLRICSFDGRRRWGFPSAISWARDRCRAT